MAETDYSTTVCVEEKFLQRGYWVLTSNELPGFMLSGKDLDALRGDTPEVIKAFFRLNYGMSVEVKRHVQPDELKKRVPAELLRNHPGRWVAIPRAA